MDDSFDLPVDFKGKELMLPSKITRFGYTYQIEVDVNGTPIRFERDEERNWRAAADSDVHHRKMPDINLLQAIAHSLDKIVNS